MKLLVTYDIKKPRRLNKVARLMQSFGERVQKSVFECEIDKIQYKDMCKQMEELIENEDSVRMYSLCSECKERIVLFGKNHPNLVQDEDFLFI